MYNCQVELRGEAYATLSKRQDRLCHEQAGGLVVRMSIPARGRIDLIRGKILQNRLDIGKQGGLTVASVNVIQVIVVIRSSQSSACIRLRLTGVRGVNRRWRAAVMQLH